MTPESQTKALREAVGVFHSAQELEAAIDLLQQRGFDRSELSVLASENSIVDQLGDGWVTTGDLADHRAVSRTAYAEAESLSEMRGGIVAAAAYVPALVGAVLTAATGGSILVVALVAGAFGGVGGSFGLWLAHHYGKGQARAMETHLRNGGLLLWVCTRDGEREMAALDTMHDAGASDVHLQDLPVPSPAELEAARMQPVIQPQNRFVW